MTNVPTTTEDITKGTKGIFTSRLNMKFDIRVAENTPKGSARINIQYLKSREVSSVPIHMVTLTPVVKQAEEITEKA